MRDIERPINREKNRFNDSYLTMETTITIFYVYNIFDPAGNSHMSVVTLDNW